MIVDAHTVVDDLFEFLYQERDELNAGHAESREEMVHRHKEVGIILTELKRLIALHTTE
jgi:hypothetical protein